MESLSADTVEQLFQRDSRLVNLLCPSLGPSQFCGYAKKQLKGALLTDVLTLLSLPKYGNKEEKIKRLFHYFYLGLYPENETPFDFDDKFIKIIQSIIQQTAPVVPKSFLSFFNRKEDHELLKQRIKAEKLLELKNFLKLVECEVGKNKDDKVEKVMRYLRPDLLNHTPKKKLSEEKPQVKPEQQVKPEPKEKTTKKKSDPKSKEPKKRKVTGEQGKPSKKRKTDNSGIEGKKEINPELEKEKEPVGYWNIPGGDVKLWNLPGVEEKKKEERKKEGDKEWNEFEKMKKQELEAKAAEIELKRFEIKELQGKLGDLMAQLNADEENQKSSSQILEELKNNFKKHLESDSPNSFELEAEYLNLEAKRVTKLLASPILDSLDD